MTDKIIIIQMNRISHIIDNTVYHIDIPHPKLIEVWMKMMCIQNEFIPSLATLKYAREEDAFSFSYLSYLLEETSAIEIRIQLSPIHYIEEIVCAFAQMYDDHFDSNDLSQFIDCFLFYRHQKSTIERDLQYIYDSKSLECFDLSKTYSLMDFVKDLLYIHYNPILN
jgi:hypothetical protein